MREILNNSRMRHCISLEDWEDLLRVGLDITSREYKNDSCGYCLSVAAVSHLVDMPQTPKRGYTCTCAHNSSSCFRCSILIEMHLLASETSFKMAHSRSIPRSRKGGVGRGGAGKMKGAHRLPDSQGTFWCVGENTRIKWLSTQSFISWQNKGARLLFLFLLKKHISILAGELIDAVHLNVHILRQTVYLLAGNGQLILIWKKVFALMLSLFCRVSQQFLHHL